MVVVGFLGRWASFTVRFRVPLLGMLVVLGFAWAAAWEGRSCGDWGFEILCPVGAVGLGVFGPRVALRSLRMGCAHRRCGLRFTRGYIPRPRWGWEGKDKAGAEGGRVWAVGCGAAREADGFDGGRGFFGAMGFVHGTLPRTALRDVGCAWVCLGRGVGGTVMR